MSDEITQPPDEDGPTIGTIIPVNIEDEMRTSYMDYAMSVIIGRALPDVRDGLKPVHRRVLYAMYEQKNSWNGPYKKSARIVGDVIGKYHPHGDQSAYDTLVRLAQDFSMRHPLVDGQGNFGSVDGDPPAAMRYTEVRLMQLAHEMLADIEKDTVDFADNYDGSTTEPTVLPTRFPQLLVNGSAGIAVGMATNMPPHNMTEVINGTIALIRNPEIDVEGLMEYIQGPDFPTRGFAYGKQGIIDAYTTGRGSVRMRAKMEIEPVKDRTCLVVTELPYQVNKSRLVERMAGLVQQKRIEGISDIRDESDRHGMRLVIVLKMDATPEIVRNQLFAHTQLQDSFSINALAIVDGEPKTLTLKMMLQNFVEHRRDVVTRRCRYELKKAEARHHILLGFKIALENIDEVIEKIRASADSQEARAALCTAFGFSETQAQAILDMRLHRLTSMETNKILDELKEVEAEMDRLKAILGSDELLMGVVVGELEEVRDKFGEARRTMIVDADPVLDFEDLIPDDDVVVTISRTGYVKRMPVSLFRAQRRGGKGRVGATLRDDDAITNIFYTSMKTDLLVFTSFGRVYRLKVYELPPAQTMRNRGKPIVQMIPVEKSERVCSILPIKSYEDWDHLFFATAKGIVKKTPLSEYESIRSNGKIAISLMHGDDLVRAFPVRNEQHVLLSTRHGLAIRFPVDEVRAVGRGARGVTGIRLRTRDKVVGADPLEEGLTVLSVTERGYGKRSDLDQYRVQHRAGKGIITMQRNKRNGNIVSAMQVEETNGLLLMTDAGQLIRISVDEIPTIGRNTMGVRLFKVSDDQKIVAIERVVESDEDEEGLEGEEGIEGAEGESQEGLPLDGAEDGEEIAEDSEGADEAEEETGDPEE